MGMYQIGDKVRIRDDLGCRKIYRHNDGTNAINVNPEMCALHGKFATITEVTKSGRYHISIDPFDYVWVDEMFEMPEIKFPSNESLMEFL